MKRILFFILLIASFAADAQVKQQMGTYGIRARRIQPDSAFRLPTVQVGIRDQNLGFDTAQVRYNKTDSTVETYTGSQWIPIRGAAGSGSGTVTSVGLTMPSAFSVANSPVTGAGTLAVTGAGTTLQYIRGDGSLATLPVYTAGDGLLLTGSEFKVLTKRSITIDNDSLMLVNDSTGGAYYLYGRNIANRLGFYRPDTNYIANFSTMVRPLISLTTTGSSGAATYNNSTGVLNVPQYSGGGSSTYTLEADSLTGWALDFDYTKGHNVNHGYFWPYTDSFYKFFNEVWLQPDSAVGGWTGYYISSGYGGSHFFLGGVESTSAGWYLTGNVWDGVGTLANYTWTAYDVMPNNTLHYVAVGYDGAQIVCYIDGVPSGKLTFTDYRTSADATQWFTGGSDHNNFNGKILRIRHFEDDLPIPLGYWFYPKWIFDGAMPNTVLNVDYTQPANIIDDMSPGFWGVKHPGFRSSMAPGEKPFAGIQNSVNTAIDGRPDSLLPQWTKMSFQKSTYTGGSPTIPGSAVIYDSYMRADITPAWQISPALDSTEGGTAGKKAYQFISNSGSGILNTQAWLYRSGGSDNYLYVDAGVSDQDIRVTQTIGDKGAEIIGRHTDNSNFIYVQRSGTTMYIVKKVAGTPTVLDSYTTTGTYTELKLVLSGGAWTVYEDGVSKATGGSIADVPLGTNAGWGVVGFYSRVKKFEVY